MATNKTIALEIEADLETILGSAIGKVFVM